MSAIQVDEFKLIGLALPEKTTNEAGQSSIDCGNLWLKFEQEKYFEKIPGKLDDEVIAVYHEYEGDHTKPFSYFIGCKVSDDTNVPTKMESITVPKGVYKKFIAIGKMPDCIINVWRDIWDSDIRRAYHTDFEVYDKESKDGNNARVEIFISISEC